MPSVYLLDANVLIESNRTYYPIAHFPLFWDWLAFAAEQGDIKMPRDIYDEVEEGPDGDPLYRWMRLPNVVQHLILPDENNAALIQQVVAQYAQDLQDIEIERLGKDPILIAHALRDWENRCVVSMENSAPAKQRANRKVPDVCRDLTVSCCNVFGLIKALNFTTNWRR